MKSTDVDLFTGVVPFVTTAELQSFRAAARQLGLTPSAVSKAITRLETKLGVRLLNRTSRAVSLTDEGHAFLLACRDAVAFVRAAEERLGQTLKAPRGQLSLSLPLMLGKLVILPALKQLCDRHPGLTVRASLFRILVKLREVILTGTRGEQHREAHSAHHWSTPFPCPPAATHGVTRATSGRAASRTA